MDDDTPRLILPKSKLIVPAGEAMQINREPGTQIIIDGVDVRFAEDGPLILMPLERWVRTLGRAIAFEQARESAGKRLEEYGKSRQQRRHDQRN